MSHSDPFFALLQASSEMCEAWDSLRAMLDGSETERYELDEGRIEVVRRTKRMTDARQNIAALARDFAKEIA